MDQIAISFHIMIVKSNYNIFLSCYHRDKIVYDIAIMAAGRDFLLSRKVLLLFVRPSCYERGLEKSA